MSQVPLLEYLADEASSGTGPTTIGDTSAGTALPLTITYGTGAAWTSIGAGKGLAWATSGNTGAVSGALNGTKVEAALAGTTKATWEIVCNTGTSATYQVLAHLGGVAAEALLTIAQNNAGVLDLYVNDALIGSFTVSTGLHVLTLAIDTTQATPANRCILYVDGSAVTLTGTSFPAQNQAIDAAGSNYANNRIAIGCFGSVSSLPATGSTIYYAALYAVALSSAEAAANATALAANNDADPNSSVAAFVPRRRAPVPESVPDDAVIRRRRAPIVPVVTPDNPPPRAARRRTEEPQDDIRVRRKFAITTVPATGTTVMPLGDSITRGAQGATGAGGWRTAFFSPRSWLTTVGSQLDIDISDPRYKYHEGHDGYTSADVLSNIASWYSANPADIVLLMIGTNDFLTSVPTATYASNLAAICDAIHAIRASCLVYVGKIIYQTPSAGTDATVETYRVAGSAALAGKANVIEVTFGTMANADYADDTHPDQSGYDIMADVWAQGVWYYKRRPRVLPEETLDEPRARRRLAPIVAAVTPDNPPPRASTARARMLADESRFEPDPRARKPIFPLRGSISITSDRSTAAVDLTAIGTSDWRTWVGPTKPTDAIRKITGGSQISDWALQSWAGPPVWTPGYEPNVVQWSDGNPTLSGSHSGVLGGIPGAGRGFNWTVPADPNPRTLHLYLGAVNVGGGGTVVTATLSDGSADDGVAVIGTDGEWNVHITFNAASVGKKLTVVFYTVDPSPSEIHIRGLALVGPAAPADTAPFIRRLWQALTTWDTEEPRARRPFAPIPPPPAPDDPPPRVRARQAEAAEDERRLPRPRLPILPASVVDNPPPRARARTVDAPEDDVRARRPAQPIAAHAPPPRTSRRREDEPEEVTGRRNRKLVPQPAAVVNNPPPRAGRSNWRVAWDSWEPVELLRKVYRIVFPGVTSTTPVPPFHVVEDDYARTNVDSTVALSVLADEIVLEVSPMKPRKVGDNASPYSGTLYSNGAPRSLAGSTVALWMWDSRTHAVKLAGVACTVEPSGTGTWSYLPSAAEVGPASIYEYELRETTSGGKVATYPSTGRTKFVIEEAIG